jgi:phosphatidate cytidylyltransferase
LFLFAVIWCTDSFAYFTGIFLGRHRLAPHISPKKTVEGAVGGLFGGIGGAVLIGEIFLDFSLSDLVILGLLLSAIGQLGDLIESLLKRNYGVKDSGNFLPGHGGLLDRFDSVLLSGPFLYYYLKYFLS